jgi:hypothetical protein
MITAEDILDNTSVKAYRYVVNVAPTELYKLSSHSDTAVRFMAVKLAPNIDLPLFIADKNQDIQKLISERFLSGL